MSAWGFLPLVTAIKLFQTKKMDRNITSNEEKIYWSALPTATT